MFPLHAQGQIGGSQPPAVFISPSSSNTSGSAATTQVNVTVEACDDGALSSFALDLKLDGQAVAFTSAGTSTTSCTGFGQQVWTAAVTLTSATHTLSATVCDEQFPPECTPRAASYTYTQVGSGGGTTPAVEVSPDGGSVEVMASNVSAQVFTVENTGTGTDPIALSASCTGGLSECKETHASVTVAPGQSTQVGVTYRAPGDGATGTMTLTATQPDGSGGQVSDVGTLSITGRSVPWTSVAEPDMQGATVEKSLCLTVAAGPGAAYECGRLRMAHGLPGVRLLNRGRAPTLLYNSDHAHPQPVVGMDVTPPAASGTPDEVKLTITQTSGPSGSTLSGSRTFAGWAGGAWRRIAVDADGEALATGIYGYTLTAEARYGSTWQTVQQRTGRLVIVNRVDSPFGRGWWLAGLEQLVSPSTTASEILWVGGDGSTRVYKSAGTNVWGAETEPFRPDTLRYVNGEYVRDLPGDAKVVFNSAGQHVRTVDRLTRTTFFDYGSNGRLWRLRTARPSGLPSGDRLDYTFEYNASYGGTARLSAVRAPYVQTGGDRDVLVTYSGNRMSIEDPGSPRTTVHYDYTTTQLGHRIHHRTDRRGSVTEYTFRQGGFLASSIRYGGGSVRSADDVVTIVVPAEWRGLSAPTQSNYTWMNGARTDVEDHTLFYVDRFGAPYRIRDAWMRTQGTSTYDTWIYRQNPRFPALVTMTRTSAGTVANHAYRYQTAAYDEHGHLIASTDRSTHEAGRFATTLYAWDEAAEAVSTTVSPAGEVTRMGYDAWGRRVWQQVGDDSTRRVNFGYFAPTHATAPGLLQTVTDPVGNVQTLAYNTRGNLASVTSPTGIVTTHMDDRLGRDTAVVSPIDASGGTTRARTVYDLADRATQTVTTATAGGVTETVTVDTDYDAEGNTLSVDRTMSPDPNNIGTSTTTWEYDWLGRAFKETDAAGRSTTTTFDHAGNAVSVLTRRGHTITMQYDVLNRLTQRTTPGDDYGTDTTYVGGVQWSFPRNPVDPDNPSQPGAVPGDVATYGYDIAGNTIQADNADAQIDRVYNVNGTLASETQAIRTYTGSNFTSHVYTIGYEYDLNGRRIATNYPPNLVPANQDRAEYGYDPETGALATVTDLAGNVVSYVYDDAGRRERIELPGGVMEASRYDAESRVRFQELTVSNAYVGTSTGFATSQIAEDSMVYDLRGKVIAKELDAAIDMSYSPMGPLTDFEGNYPYSIKEVLTVDPLGNVMDEVGGQVNIDDNGQSGGGLTRELTRYGYSGATGRLVGVQWIEYPLGNPYVITGERLQGYDLEGNQVSSNEWRAGGSGGKGNGLEMIRRVTRQYYGADGKLRAVDSQACAMQGVYCVSWDESSYGRAGSFEEYRYDALGRRILVRRRYDSECQYTCHASMERFVWDGQQILVEIRVDGDGSSVEMEYDSGIGEQYGRVAYVHGPGIDQPVSVTRMGNWSDPTFLPHRNWRGHHAGASYADGTIEKNGLNLYDIPWPGDAFDATLNAPPESGNPPWLGSLLVEKTDASGQLYMRNRYFDPHSGRFTQEDPIGLAGGLNLYGFGGGDAVNYSDPFGLCPKYLTGRPCGDPLIGVRNVLRSSSWNPDVGAFGMVRNGGTRPHQGLDILAPKHLAVSAVDDGVVLSTRYTNSYGNQILIGHKNEDGEVVSYSFYAHLNSVGDFEPGQEVAKGDLIGAVGDTGNAKGTPSHLHFELRVANPVGRGLTGRIDPEPHMPVSRDDD